MTTQELKEANKRIKETIKLMKIAKEKGRQETLKEVEKMIDECDCDKEYKIKVMQLKHKLKELGD